MIKNKISLVQQLGAVFWWLNTAVGKSWLRPCSELELFTTSSYILPLNFFSTARFVATET